MVGIPHPAVMKLTCEGTSLVFETEGEPYKINILMGINGMYCIPIVNQETHIGLNCLPQVPWRISCHDFKTAHNSAGCCQVFGLRNMLQGTCPPRTQARHCVHKWTVNCMQMRFVNQYVMSCNATYLFTFVGWYAFCAQMQETVADSSHDARGPQISFIGKSRVCYLQMLPAFRSSPTHDRDTCSG